jgi:hypothetical protein
LDIDELMVLQPLLESVRTFGELSVFVLGGRAGLAARKLPQSGEIRVHEEFGGVTERTEPTPQARALAERVVATAERVVGAGVGYSRVDLMLDDDGALVLSELEMTEPGLYLDVLPDNAEQFAELLRRVHPPRPREGGQAFFLAWPWFLAVETSGEVLSVGVGLSVGSGLSVEVGSGLCVVVESVCFLAWPGDSGLSSQLALPCVLTHLAHSRTEAP